MNIKLFLVFLFYFFLQATVTVGDVICFFMPVKFIKDDINEWMSDNIKTLAINSSSGFSVAVSPSEVFVTYSNSKFSTSTSIIILPIKTVHNSNLLTHFYK